MKNNIKLLKYGMFLFILGIISCDNDDTIIDTKPVAAFNINKEVVALGQSIVFTDLSFDQNGSLASWNWDFGDGTTSTEQSPEHNYELGEFTITLTVTDNTGNENVNEFFKTITVLVPSTATTEPNILWSYDVPWTSQYASLAFSNGTAYVATDGKSSDPSRGPNVLAIKDGKLLWSDLTDEVIRMSPSIDANGTLYVGDYFAFFNAYNQDGTLKWSRDLGNRIRYASPAFASDGTIYLGMENDDVLLAINPENGSIKWTFPVGHDIRATPAVGADGTIYVASSDGYFYAVNPDGTEKWKVLYGEYTVGAPAISNSKNTIYLTYKTSDDTGHLTAFNMDDGSVIWDNASRPLAIMEQGGPTIAADGTIYAGGEDNKMVAYNSDDGSIKWEFETINSVLAAPALDNDGNLYFGDTSGNFYVVGPDGETEWARTQLNEEINSSAAIDGNGVVYILTRNNTENNGKVYALKTNATGLLVSEWPMLSKDAKHTGR